VDLDDAFASVRAAYARYRGFLVNFQACKKAGSHCITWQAFQRIRLDPFPTYLDFVDMVDRGQYSFQTDDGAIFQLFYVFDRREVVSASLSFVRAYSLRREMLDADASDEAFEGSADDEPEMLVTNPDDRHLEEGDEEDSAAAIEAASGNHDETRIVSWIRCDYDEVGRHGLAHAACHLHLNGFPESRLPVRGIPTPIQFVDFVIALAYPDIFNATHLDADGNLVNRDGYTDANRNQLGCSDAESVDLVVHLRLPGLTRV
jgi:hypothetical protein